ncbi:MAG: aminotransferase class I/II-fold pyridoxal phosphate-dependent enzyme [Pseudomonadota bacterium]
MKNVHKYDFIRRELDRRDRIHHRRRLKTVTPLERAEVLVDGRRLINFCSNDYLGLSKHPLLKSRALEFIEKYGAGSTASRLICGSLDCFDRIENKLAALKGTGAALILNSGFQANVSIIPALADRRGLILSDALNHNSLIQGALLARCRIFRYRHNDLRHLRDLLVENRDRGFTRKLILTESVFSMDGDRSDIRGLADLAEEFGAFLVVDEAHATGVLGRKGMGLSCGEKVDVAIGTFSKGCGSFGAYAACSEEIRAYLINFCNGFIYSTALPPAVIGAIDAALELIPDMDDARRHLEASTEYLRMSLKNTGWETGPSSSQIVPIIIGSERETIELSGWLEKGGIFATPIRPPTVSPGESRIRLSLSVFHGKREVDRVIELLQVWRERRAA